MMVNGITSILSHTTSFWYITIQWSSHDDWTETSRRFCHFLEVFWTNSYNLSWGQVHGWILYKKNPKPVLYSTIFVFTGSIVFTFLYFKYIWFWIFRYKKAICYSKSILGTAHLVTIVTIKFGEHKNSLQIFLSNLHGKSTEW